MGQGEGRDFMGLTFYQLIGYFFIYSFLGWCSEVSFQALSKGKLVNRGFLNGPVCPIYGVGVVLVIWILEPLAAHGLILFFGSILLCSILEWITGFVLEKLFHQKWWDYSGEPFNLGGYICLRFSIMWGLACSFIVYLVHPTIAGLTALIPHTLGVILLSILGAVFLVDCAATIKTIIGFNHELKKIDSSAAKLKKVSDELTETIYETAVRAKEETAELKARVDDEKKTIDQHKKALAEKLTYSQRRLLKAFPGARSTRYAPAMEEMKRRLENYMKEKRRS